MTMKDAVRVRLEDGTEVTVSRTYAIANELPVLAGRRTLNSRGEALPAKQHVQLPAATRKDDLLAEIAARNAERTDDAQIVPDSELKDDLLAALEADDKATAAARSLDTQTSDAGAAGGGQ